MTNSGECVTNTEFMEHMKAVFFCM